MPFSWTLIQLIYLLQVLHQSIFRVWPSTTLLKRSKHFLNISSVSITLIPAPKVWMPNSILLTIPIFLANWRNWNSRKANWSGREMSYPNAYTVIILMVRNLNNQLACFSVDIPRNYHHYMLSVLLNWWTVVFLEWCILQYSSSAVGFKP